MVRVFKDAVTILAIPVSEQLRDLYVCINNIKITKLWVVRLARHSACMGKKRNACCFMVSRYERKSSFGKPRYR